MCLEDSKLRQHSAKPSKRSPVSAEIADWDRERCQRLWDPGKRLIASIRSYQFWLGRWWIFGSFMSKVAVLRHRWWSIVTAAEVPLTTKIGGGLLLTHPSGVVVHAKSEIGVNCLLFQQVTIGTGGKIPGVPVLAGHVDVGAGAKILGGVRIGKHVKIGANAVVLDDIPDYATAVGAPARIVNYSHSEA